MLSELGRPRQRPVTNVVAVFVIAVTFLPILAAYDLTRGTESVGGEGKWFWRKLPCRPRC